MGDKTESPTPRRLEEARSEGRVIRSIELNSAAILLVSALLLKGPGSLIVNGLRAMLTTTLTTLPQVTLTDLWLRDWVVTQLIQVGPGLALVMFGLLATGVTVTIAQTGFMWTSKKIGFDFTRVNPLSGFKRLFSSQGLIELARALFKLGLVGYVAYSFLRGHINDFLLLGKTDFTTGIQNWVELASSLAINIGGAYLVLACADYAYQRYRYVQSMKMTKDEVKQDMKSTEGDPFLRGRIRAQQRKIARNRMMANVHKASVVITNPTHLAIAIEYNSNTMGAPRVLAKGAFKVAERIVGIAKTNRIPVVQNIPVARAIYRAVDVNQEIPPELYMAVAEVLAYVYKLRGQVASPAHA